jgi:hypothetical protein
MGSPMTLARKLEGRPALTAGAEERFRGYGVMGLAFASGHRLAFRRMTQSSIGSPYTSVWHRAPEGAWTLYVDVESRKACPRYFGKALDRVVESEIKLCWEGPREVSLLVPGARLQWALRLSADALTRGLTILGRSVPGRLRRSPRVLSVVGRAGGRSLGLGPLALTGRAPNGQRYRVSPRLVWRIEASAAVLDGEELGGPAPLEGPDQLGDFLIPAKGILAFGEASFERFDPARHTRVTVRPGWREAGAVPAK